MSRDFLDRLRSEAGGTLFLVTGEMVDELPWLHVYRLPE
jgi:hypothetical protein